jgi:hypothetical protein
VQMLYLEDGPETVLQPWEENPYDLVSWLDVLQFSAYSFFFCGRALREIKSDCYIASIPGDGDTPIFALPRPLDGLSISKATKSLSFVETEFRKIGLVTTAEMAKDVVASLEKPANRMRNYQWLIDQVAMLEKLADLELHGKFFLYIPPERAKFWPAMNKLNIFGDEVATKFPSATFDAANGGVCLATMMSTASVFHLMRVLEIGLTALGAVFAVSLAHTNWGPAIEEIEKKIRGMHADPAWKAMPDCKEQQEFYAQAASHFGVLKDAWRNYTMHARGKYTEGEAELIFENVKAFMQKLATRLQE